MKVSEEDIHIATKDFLVSGEEFSLVRNSKFGFLETRPQPNEEDLPQYYESDEYISHSDSKSGVMAFLYQAVKKRSLKKKVKLIQRLHSGKGSLLDIGAGTGAFLKLAKEKGWKISGVEPNSKARALANEKKISLSKSIDQLSGQQFDVISLWHVLEHLPNLELTIQKIVNLLKEDGVLVIAVPNYNSSDAKYYKTHWAAYDVPRHLWHFSQQSMVQLFSSECDLKKIKPMIFDSFYVSLLSEKYKTGKGFSMRAFFIGLWSNIRAWRTTEYSSLIYCFKKSKFGN